DHNNAMGENTRQTTPPEERGYKHYAEKVEGYKIRARSKSFDDHFSQPRIFLNSMSPVEKQHLIKSLSFQIGSVENVSVRQQAVDILVNVDQKMSYIVADNVVVNLPNGINVMSASSYLTLIIDLLPRHV